MIKLPTTEDVAGPVDDPFKPCDTCPCGIAVEYANPQWHCLCGPTERIVRRIAIGAAEPMTPAQREWCLDEIVHGSEGARREDHQNDSDIWLADAVLRAWQDFARDKGMF